MKDATGASVENLSALEDVARRGGTSFDAMQSVLVKFNKGLNDTADPGSKVAALLKELGLSAAELKAIDPAEALRRTAVAFESYADDGNKARAFQELFGKSIVEAGKFMHDLGTQTGLVAKVTTEAADEAKRFSDQLDAMEKNSLDLARTFAGPLISSLNVGIEKFNKARVAVTEYFTALRKQESTEENAAAEQSRLDRIKTLNALLLTGNLTLERRARLENQLAGLELRTPIDQQSDDRPGETRDRARAKPSLKIPGAPGKTEAEKTDANRLSLAAYVDQLDKELQKTKDIGEEAQAVNRLKSLGLLGEIPQVRELVLGLAAEVDERKNNAELKRLDIEVEKERARQQKQVEDFARGGSGVAQRVRDETASLTLNATELRRRTEFARFDQEVERAGIGLTGERIEQLQRLAEVLRKDLGDALDEAQKKQQLLNESFSTGANKAFDEYVETAQNKSKQAEDATKRALNGIEDAFVSVATKGKADWRGLADSIISDIVRIQAKAAISGILKYIGLGSGGAATTTADFFEQAGKRAAGGPVSAGMTYLVGEQGPELLTMGNSGGNITPNHKLGAGGGLLVDHSGNTTINVGQGVSRAEVFAAVQQGNAATEKRIRRLIAQGSFS